MAYTLDYIYSHNNMDINTEVKIKVFESFFEVECEDEVVEQDIINFLEYLDVELIALTEEGLRSIIDKEYELK